MLMTKPKPVSILITSSEFMRLLHSGPDAQAENDWKVMYNDIEPEHINDPEGFHPII